MSLPSRKGVPRGKKLGKVGRLSVREAAYLYHVLGLKTEEVAERAGVKPGAILKAFARYGINRRAGGPHGRKILREDFDEAGRRGWTKAKLAARLGVTTSGLFKAQRRMGYEWPERDGNHSPK